MVELLKRIFDLYVKNRWLKSIDKECDKYIKLEKKLKRQQMVINGLVKRYQEIYGEDLRNSES